MAESRPKPRIFRNRKRVTMRTLNILIPMKLRGQAHSQCSHEQGYAMAALLVAMSIMAVMLTVAMPVWKQMTQREREEELVFRGMQYAHAIGMFQRKYANAYPPNLDVLVNEHFLRRKFKDPVTNDDFVPIVAGQNAGIGVGTAGASATPRRAAALDQVDPVPDVRADLARARRLSSRNHRPDRRADGLDVRTGDYGRWPWQPPRQSQAE